MDNSKIRIYQLSRQLNLDNKEVLAVCAQLKITVKTHSSTITKLQADQLRAAVTQSAPEDAVHSLNSEHPEQASLTVKHSKSHLSASRKKRKHQPLPNTQQSAITPALDGKPVEAVPELAIAFGSVSEQQATDAAASEPSPEINLKDPQYYFNRALSWLAFNNRVLHEAFDSRTPLLERLKFLAIFSSNLDEFFMVRVAGLKQQVEATLPQKSADGLTPEAQLEAISQQLHPVVVEQHRYFSQELRGQLAAQRIHILKFNDLNPEQRTYLQHYFETQIFPVLTPLAVDPAHPFPYISSLSLNLAVLIQDAATGEEHFARVKVPNVLPRFVTLPEHLQAEKNQKPHWSGVPLEEIIAHNLEFLFPGMNIQEYFPFRITRSVDLELERDEADDLLLAIEQELRRRRFGSVVRMEIQATAPEAIRQLLMRELALKQTDIYEVEGLLCLNDLMALRDLPFPHLKEPDWSPVVPPRIRKLEQQEIYNPALSDRPETLSPDSAPEEQVDIFSTIREGDLLVHHPYDSFTATVQRFITQAAFDPDVLAIKMTLYRTSGDSPIVNALIAAAENGKQVAVLV
ncbi:MAG TPA: translation initiation factor IF-2 N-terminal domain-containing protein, partial [Candidatus Caenarcaniphilales bacterium]